MTSATLLFRQVNPSWVQQGRVTSQVFRPTNKDAGLLSVHDGDLVSAEQAWGHFTGQLGCLSAGVLAVSVEECTVQQLPTRADPSQFREHALIDFTAYGSRDIERKAKCLRYHAEQRGWQYQAKETRF